MLNAAQLDAVIAGYEDDRRQVYEKMERAEKTIRLMPDDGYRKSHMELRNHLQATIRLYDGLIADYKAQRAKA